MTTTNKTCNSLAVVAEPSVSDPLHLISCQLQLVIGHISWLRLLCCFIDFNFLTS